MILVRERFQEPPKDFRKMLNSIPLFCLENVPKVQRLTRKVHPCQGLNWVSPPGEAKKILPKPTTVQTLGRRAATLDVYQQESQNTCLAESPRNTSSCKTLSLFAFNS